MSFSTATSELATPQPGFRPLPENAREVLLLVNRKAGSGRRREVIAEVEVALERENLSASVITDIDTLRQQSAELLAAGRLRAVVAAGGDGTFGATLNSTPAGTPLAIIPMGTENLLGRYACHTRSPQQVAELLARGVVVSLDAGAAGDRLFAVMLSAGFDAEVVRRVHGCRKGNITHLAYAAPIFGAVCGYGHPPFELRWQGEAGEWQTIDTRWLFALNLPRYAMQIPIAPHASGFDGQIDVCAFRHGSLVSGLRYLAHVLLRRHERLPDVTTLRRPHFQLASREGAEIPYQLDGDPGGFLPVEVRVIPGRMQMVVDRRVALDWGAIEAEVAAAAAQ